MKVIGLHIKNHTLRREKGCLNSRSLFILKTRGSFKVSIFFSCEQQNKKKKRGYDASAIFHYKGNPSKPFRSWIKQVEGKREELDVSEGSFHHLPPSPQTQVSFLDSLSYTSKIQEQRVFFPASTWNLRRMQIFSIYSTNMRKLQQRKRGLQTEGDKIQAEKRSMKITYSQKLYMVQKKPDMPKLPPLRPTDLLERISRFKV